MHEYAGRVAHHLYESNSPAEAIVLAAVIAIKIGVEDFEGREADHFENLAAHAVMAGYSAESESAMLKKLSQDAWFRVQSPIGMRNMFLINEKISSNALESIDQIRMIAVNASAERRRANEMSMDDACAMIRENVDSLKAKFPQLGLSFGYIGNCDLGCGPKYDDRSWMVFTHHRKPENAAYSLSWGGYPSERLGLMALESEKNLEAWCEKQITLLGIAEKQEV